MAPAIPNISFVVAVMGTSFARFDTNASNLDESFENILFKSIQMLI
jgi:hypothetical protein